VANPQIEEGYTKIANELLDVLIQADLLGAELQVCFFVIRKTYGFNKIQDEISLTQFEKALRKTRPTIVKALRNLQLVNILKLVKRGNSKTSSNIYMLNKDYDTWKLVKTPQLVKSNDSTSKMNASQLVKPPLHTKESTKENTKESRGKKFTPPSLDEVEKYCRERRRGVDAVRWHNFYMAKNWMIGRNKMKDWKAAVRTWEQKQKEEPVAQQETPYMTCPHCGQECLKDQMIDYKGKMICPKCPEARAAEAEGMKKLSGLMGKIGG